MTDDELILRQRYESHLRPWLESLLQEDRVEVLARLYLAQQYDELPEDGQNSMINRLRREAIASVASTPQARDTLNRQKRGVIRDLLAAHLPNRSVPVEDALRDLSHEVQQLKLGLDAAPKKPASQVLAPPSDKIYLIVFSVFIIATGALVYYGWAKTPEVSIQWELGSIIQGVAVGTAALLAALTYVRRRG